MEVVWKVFKFELRKLMMFGSAYKVSLIKKRYMEVVWKVFDFHDVWKLYGKCLVFKDSLTLEEEIVFQNKQTSDQVLEGKCLLLFNIFSMIWIVEL